MTAVESLPLRWQTGVGTHRPPWDGRPRSWNSRSYAALRPLIFCFHHPEDRVCPWRHARAIIGAVDARQAQLGLPAAQVTELAELDRTSAKTTARQLEQGLAPQMHGYQDTAFLGDRFLRAFLRGPGARAHGGGW
ncbi:unnamed protein product, partial [Prorocentrum cordatum]